MIFFSQGPTAHSRLGNSIEWMVKAAHLCTKLNIEVCFPWAIENFSDYLVDDSYWLFGLEKASCIFKEKFEIELSAKELSIISRRYESSFEKINNLSPYGWTSVVYEDSAISVLYLTGKIDLTSDFILDKIMKSDVTICHEPFSMNYFENFLLIGDRYDTVSPNLTLYNAEKNYVHCKSAGKFPIGFHIRRGDYQKWQNGVYCYDDDLWLKNAKRLIDDGVSLWVFSNSLTDIFESRLLDFGVNISNNHHNVDFVRMMFMRKIYGPPSTYSGKAAAISRRIFGNECDVCFLPKI
jgi:hypothetical protein